MENEEKHSTVDVKPFLAGDYMRQPGSQLFAAAANLLAENDLRRAVSQSQGGLLRRRTVSAKSLALEGFLTAGARRQRAVSTAAEISTKRTSQVAEARDQATKRAEDAARP